MSPASKRRPVVTMDAVSSRDRRAFASGDSSMPRPAMLSSSSATTWPSPSWCQGRSVSGSITRRTDALDRRAARWPTGSVVPVTVEVVVPLIVPVIVPVSVEVMAVSPSRGSFGLVERASIRGINESTESYDSSVKGRKSA